MNIRTTTTSPTSVDVSDHQGGEDVDAKIETSNIEGKGCDR